MIADLIQSLAHGVNWLEVEQSQGTRPPAKQELRILMITPRYYPQRGKIENHVYQIAHRLAQFGHDITVLTHDNHQRILVQEQVAGVKIQRVTENIDGETYDAALDLYAAIRYGHWDIIHVQSSHTLIALLGMYAAWQARIPYVVTLHGGDVTLDPQNPLCEVQQRLLRPLLARSARLIAPTSFAIEYYQPRLQLPAEHFVLIADGTDSAVNLEPFSPEHEVLIAALGRLESNIGQHRLIAAMPHILASYPAARLRILGEDLNYRALVHQALVLGVADHVEIAALSTADFAGVEVGTADAMVVTVLSQDQQYVAAVMDAMPPKRSVLIGNHRTEHADGKRHQQVRMVDSTSTPQEIAAAVIEQLQGAFSEARRHLPTWDDCAHELSSLYYAFTGTPLGTTTEACFA